MSDITDFIARWKASGSSEQANSQLFLAELCAVLGLPPPDPASEIYEENTYAFERKVYVPRGNGANELRQPDLYRKGAFVLEAKQGRVSKPPEKISPEVCGLFLPKHQQVTLGFAPRNHEWMCCFKLPLGREGGDLGLR